jgi:hypothetical protein
MTDGWVLSRWNRVRRTHDTLVAIANNSRAGLTSTPTQWTGAEPRPTRARRWRVPYKSLISRSQPGRHSHQIRFRNLSDSRATCVFRHFAVDPELICPALILGLLSSILVKQQLAQCFLVEGWHSQFFERRRLSLSLPSMAAGKRGCGRCEPANRCFLG